MKKHPHKKIKIISYTALTTAIIGISVSLVSCTVQVGDQTPESKKPIFDQSNLITPIIPNPNTQYEYSLYGDNLDLIERKEFKIIYQNKEVSYRVIGSTSKEFKIQIINFDPNNRSMQECLLTCYYQNNEIAKLSYKYDKPEIPELNNPVFELNQVVYANSNKNKEFTLIGKNLTNISQNDLVIRDNQYRDINYFILSTSNNSITIRIEDRIQSSMDLECLYKNVKFATLKYISQEPIFTDSIYDSNENNDNQFTIFGSNLNRVDKTSLKVVDVNHQILDFDLKNVSENNLTIHLNQSPKQSQILTLKYNGEKVATLNYITATFNENQNLSSLADNNKQFKIFGQNLLKLHQQELLIKKENALIDYQIINKQNDWILIQINTELSSDTNLTCYYKGRNFGTLRFVSWEPVFNNITLMEDYQYMVRGNNLDRVDYNLFKIKNISGKIINSKITESTKTIMSVKLLELPEESQSLICYYKDKEVLRINYIAPEKLPIFGENNLVSSIKDNNKSFILVGQYLDKVDDTKFTIKNNQTNVEFKITDKQLNQLIINLNKDLEQDATLTCCYDGIDVATLAYQAPAKPVPPTPEKPTVEIPKWPHERDVYKPHISTTLPKIEIQVDNLDKLNSTKEYQKFKIKLTDENGNVNNGEDNLGLDGQIKVRGNTTSSYHKKPYRLKFTQKQSMFGLNSFSDGSTAKAKNWVLLADWLDISMTRNSASLYLSQYLYKEIGLYASDFRYVDVYMNGNYYGMYLLAEQNEVNESRVNINKYDKGYEGTDIGYLVEMDAYAQNIAPEKVQQRFWMDYTNQNNMLDWDNRIADNYMEGQTNWYEIKNDIYTEQQRLFIQKYMKSVYRICYEAIVNHKYYALNEAKNDVVLDSSIKDVRDAIERVVDIDSVIATIILQEMVCDYDVSNSSFYMSADFSPTGDGRLYFNAPWDFDNGLGNRNRVGNGVRYADKLYAVNTKNFWLALFYKSDIIRNGIKQRWTNLKDRNIFNNISSYIDEISRIYKSQFDANYKKWKNIAPFIEESFGNGDVAFSDFYMMMPEASYKCRSQEEAATYLKKWWDHRVKVLDSLWARELLDSSVVSVTANDIPCTITNNQDNRMQINYKPNNISFKVELASEINKLYNKETIDKLGFTEAATVSWTSTAGTFYKQGNTQIFKSNNNEKSSITFHGEIKEQGKETQYATLTLIFIEQNLSTTLFDVVVNVPLNRKED